jgi:hypothetical protein
VIVTTPPPTIVAMSPAIVTTDVSELEYTIGLPLLFDEPWILNGMSPTFFAGIGNIVSVVASGFTWKVDVTEPDK